MEEQNIMDAIRKAIANGDIKEANVLLDGNKDIINKLTSFNGTLLHDAVRYNQKELANKLIDMGIDISVKCPGSAFRGLAINLANTKEMAELLINKGVIPALSLDDFSINPISLKIEHDDLEMFLFWFDYECSRFSPKEQTLLVKRVKTWAKDHGSTDILKYLNDNFEVIKKKSIKKVAKTTLVEFETLLFNITKKMYSSITLNYGDVYAFSMVCTHTFDYIYYVANTEELYNKKRNKPGVDYDKRYNEEEWGIVIDEGEYLDALSKLLKNIMKDNLEENENLIVGICIKVMKKLKDEKYFPGNLMINIHIWEYFSDEDIIAIFLELNGKERLNEYKKFLLG